MKSWRWILSLMILALAPFVVLNLRDYARYRFVLELIEHPPVGQLRRIAEAFAAVPKAQRRDFDLRRLPADYAFLRPLHATPGTYGMNFPLYDSGEAYAEVHIDFGATSDRCKAYLFHNFSGIQKTFPFWHSDPQYAARLDPRDRRVTISSGGGHDIGCWIVTASTLVVITSGDYEGEEEIIVLDQPIDADFAARVHAAIARIPASDRGYEYDQPNVRGGLFARLTFSPDGSEDPERILLNNAWVSSLDELYAVINSACPAEHQLHDLRAQAERLAGMVEPASKHSGHRATPLPPPAAVRPPKSPWWIVWR